MTKEQYLDKYFELHKKANEDKIWERLHKLVDENRITSGTLYLYLPNYWYGATKISDVLDKAYKSKNYLRYLKRVSLWNWKYYIDDMENYYKKTLDFITEQENLPFEETQKQILIRTGEIEWV